MKKKRVLILASCLMCLSLSGCLNSNKSNIKDDGPFGFLEQSNSSDNEEETTTYYGFETRIEIEQQTETSGQSNTSENSGNSNTTNNSETSNTSENNEDEFSINLEINMDNANKSEEEIAIEEAEKETEPFLYEGLDGSIKDIREEAGYQGILKFINSYKEYGGIEAIARTSRSEIKHHLENNYFLATNKEIENVLSIIYEGSAEEKQQLEEDALHTENGFVYTDEGWKNVYEETNSENILDLSDID